MFSCFLTIILQPILYNTKVSWSTIQQKGATLEVLNLPSMNGIDDENLRRLINNLVIELYKYQAEAERKKIKERQQQGIKIAKGKGKFQGGKRKFEENDPRLNLAFDLYLKGYTDKEVEEQTGINRRTFRRYRQRYNIHRDKLKKHLNKNQSQINER